MSESQKHKQAKEKAMKAAPLLAGLVCGLALLAGPVRAQPVDSFFDVFADTTGGPPFPSEPPIGVAVLNDLDGIPPLEPTLELYVRAADGGPAGLGVEIFAFGDGGGGGGEGWVESFFDVSYHYDWPDFPAESFFDVSFDAEPPGGGDQPVLKSPPDVWHVESFFDVFVEIELPEGGEQSLHLEGAPAPGLILSDVYLKEDFPAESFFDVFFQLTVVEPSLVDPVAPVVSMKMTGSYVPEPCTAGLLALGLCGLLRRRRTR